MKEFGIYRMGENDAEWERRKEIEKFILERVFGEKVLDVEDRGYIAIFMYENGGGNDGERI